MLIISWMDVGSNSGPPFLGRRINSYMLTRFFKLKIQTKKSNSVKCFEIPTLASYVKNVVTHDKPRIAHLQSTWRTFKMYKLARFEILQTGSNCRIPRH